MDAREIAYCEYEGDFYHPWPAKPKDFNPPIVFWSDGKVYDAYCERHGVTRKITRKHLKEIKLLIS